MDLYGGTDAGDCGGPIRRRKRLQLEAVVYVQIEYQEAGETGLSRFIARRDHSVL
jgi:hypothetical protein